VWIDQTNARGGVTVPGKADTALEKIQRFTVYYLRFQVYNRSDADATLAGRLQVGSGAAPAEWQAVPEGDPAGGIPFYAASDKGRTFEARANEIAIGDLRLSGGPDDGYTATSGSASFGLNPIAMALPARSFTEVQFAVRATIDAQWNDTYAFRLLDGDAVPLDGPLAVVSIGDRPAIKLTMPANTTTMPAKVGVRYSLAVATRPPTGPAAYPLAALVDPASPHIEIGLTGDGCATCHSAHRAPASSLLEPTYRIDPLRTASESYDGADFSLCLTCHSESPFADQSGSPNPLSNFAGHGYHLGHIAGTGVTGSDITEPGVGDGNALCAECHWNLHGTPQSERGLVRFSPNVQPAPDANGEIRWDEATQSCTLTCHGKVHNGLSFKPATPAT
jgi:hypothetical protein